MTKFIKNFFKKNYKNLFIDKSFDKSLPDEYMNNKNIVWLRPIDICDKPIFINKDIYYDDVHQGNIGTCWILSSIISLIKYKDVLFNIMDPLQNFDKDYTGKFVFSFYNNNKNSSSSNNRIEIEIDDYLPYNTKKKCLIFSNNKNDKNEFWLALFEKALIKLISKSYKIANNGNFVYNCAQYLFENSDYIFSNIDNDNIEKNKQDMIKYNSHYSTIILAKKNNNKNDSIKDKNNIYYNHAYVVLDINVNKELILLINPHGSGLEYFKKISNSSDLEENKNKDNVNNDGKWWMSIKDVFDDFNWIEIIYSKNSKQQNFMHNVFYLENKLKCLYSKHFFLYEIYNDKRTQIESLNDQLKKTDIKNTSKITLLENDIYNISQTYSFQIKINQLKKYSKYFLIIKIQDFPENLFYQIKSSNKEINKNFLKPDLYRFFNIMIHFFEITNNDEFINFNIIFSKHLTNYNNAKLEIYKTC